LSLNLSAHILRLSGKGDFDTCLSMAKTAIEDKSALNTFIKMVKAQGGNVEQIIDTNKFKKAKYTKDVVIDKDGYIVSVDAEKYGLASLILGAGRNKKEDKIDLSAGIILHAKTGDKVKRGQVLATMYTSNPTTFDKAEEILLSATDIKTEKKEIEKLIKKVIE
jgi:pyrimidine-nucleoside phosphorylase